MQAQLDDDYGCAYFTRDWDLMLCHMVIRGALLATVALLALIVWMRQPLMAGYRMICTMTKTKISPRPVSGDVTAPACEAPPPSPVRGRAAPLPSDGSDPTKVAPLRKRPLRFD